jgi:3-phenylpropionate/cinnamic acid dioxygenase small subunit
MSSHGSRPEAAGDVGAAILQGFDPVDRLDILFARAEIEDCLLRYARCIDRRDWAALGDCFHEDAIDRHGEFHGTAEEFVAWVSDRHATVPFSMHFLGNCLIEFRNEDVAAVETYFVAIQRRERTAADGAVEGTDFEVFGRYVDRFERRNGAWKMAARQVVYDSTSTRPSTNHLRKLVGVIGRRDRGDPVFERAQAAE